MILEISKEKYGLDENIVLTSDVDLIPPDSSNFELYKTAGTTYTAINFSIDASLTEIIINPTLTLDTNSIYLLVSKNISAVNGSTIPLQLNRFFSIDETFVRNYNDVYYQMRNIDNIIDLDKVVTKVDNYDYQVVPSNYNAVTKKYEYAPYTVDVNNTDIIVENYINQYFTEFGSLFLNLKNQELYNPVVSASQIKKYDEDYVNNINLLIMKNIPRYTALKGNIYLIEFIVGLYSKILGYNLISVVEDISENFSYRVSCSLPRAFWTKNIKPIVHPIGWGEIYNEITSQVQGITIDYKVLDPNNLLFPANMTSYIDAEYYTYVYNIGISRNANMFYLKNIYHTQGGIEATNAVGHSVSGHSTCSFQTVYDERKFNIKFAGGYHDTNYRIPSILPTSLAKIAQDHKQYKSSYTSLDNLVSFTYKQSGIATSYIWKKFRGSKLLDVISTPFNHYETTLDKYEHVELTLSRNDWKQKVFSYDLTQYIPFKPINCSWTCKNNKKKFTHVRNYTDHYSYNGISYNSFNSEKCCVTSSATTAGDFDYNFSLPASAALFASEFDTNTSITKTTTQYTWNGATINKNVVKYNKVGIAEKYEWKLLINDILATTKTTYLNEVTFNVDDVETNAKVYLTIHYKNGTYDLTNFLTL